MKPRQPLQVDPKFIEEIKAIKKIFKDNGIERSLRDITGDIVSSGVLNPLKDNNIKMDIRIRMDKRKW